MIVLMEKEKTLGERLKYLRGKRTQEEVAKAIGLSRARYSHYENNRVEPDITILSKLSDYYNVSVDYLLGRPTDATTEETEDPAFIAFTNDPELQNWYKELPKSPEDRLRKLKKLWEIIKDEE